MSPAEAAFDPIGIWKMCFEPGLPDVDELSEGYLVLLPDGQYIEMRADCCGPDGLPSPRQGRYRLEGRSLVLQHENVYGEAYEIRMEYVGQARVVLFDDLEHRVEAPVLRGGSTNNYGFAKVYPRAD